MEKEIRKILSFAKLQIASNIFQEDNSEALVISKRLKLP